MKRLFLLLALATAGLFLLPLPARADGVIIIDPPPPQGPAYLTVVYHHVEVTIEDQVATTRIDQLFRNDNRTTVEGTYIFPLPEEASIERFIMVVDGKPVEGRVLSREEARSIYESIVRKHRDPALLEYIGRNTFQASIFPIAPGEEKRVQIEYRQVLPVDQGLAEYVYPLSTERFSPQPLRDVAITVRLTSREPLRAVYSPSHDVSIDRPDDHHATVGYEAHDVLPDRDFALYYTVSPEDIGLNLLTYHPQGEDGFFLLLVAPPVEEETQEVVAKDVIFVLDTSGSMSGEKMEQARAALLFVLDHLNAEDRFAIVDFDSSVSAYAPELRPASERAEARRYVRDLSAGGSTHIEGALRQALDLADRASGRPQVILFLTDGLPTVGEQDPARLLALVRERSHENIRLFTFGVGYDVNSALLDALAEENHGAGAYILPGENLEERLSAFYAKISRPVLSGPTLDFGGIGIYDVYPSPLPDLFLGSQLVLAGRYREGGSATVTLRGRAGGGERTYRYEDLTFPRESAGNDFLPRLWASRKIGYLLNEIRLHGENREVVDEIVELSLRYGIITPYTSFLVDETGRVLTEEGQAEVRMRMTTALPAQAPAEGKAGVDYSMEVQRLQSGYGGLEQAGLRQVADKAFLRVNGVWTDTTYRPGTPTTPVAFGSESYFALLGARPEWGKYFAIGERVRVVLDGVAYEVVAQEVPPVTPPAGPSPTPYPSEAPVSTPNSGDGSFPWGWTLAIVVAGLGLATAAGLVLRGRHR
ncbi:MAG: VIT domain-containing protein [Chloroflexia bacterium]